MAIKPPISTTTSYADLFSEPIFSYAPVVRTKTARAKWTPQQIDTFHALRQTRSASVDQWNPDVSALRACNAAPPPTKKKMAVTTREQIPTIAPIIASAPRAPAVRNPRAPSTFMRETASFAELYPDIPTTIEEFDAKVRDLADIARLVTLIQYRPRAGTSLETALAVARRKFEHTVAHRY